jgi:hypothetical protein
MAGLNMIDAQSLKWRDYRKPLIVELRFGTSWNETGTQTIDFTTNFS